MTTKSTAPAKLWPQCCIRMLRGVKQFVKRRTPGLYEALWRAESSLRATWWKARRTKFGLYEVQNRIIDRRYGESCSGRIATRFPETGARDCTSMDYAQLARLFDPLKGVPIEPSDILVDIGCGKGRVINFWLRQGLKNRMIGLELDPAIAAQTAHRLRNFDNVSIIAGDAVDRLPRDGTLFFMYNPFGESVVGRLKARLSELGQTSARIRIVYYACFHATVFQGDTRWRVTFPALRTFRQAAIITYLGEDPH